MKTLLAIIAASAVLGPALVARAQGPDQGGWRFPTAAMASSARAAKAAEAAARAERFDSELRRRDRQRRFGLVSAVGIGADALVWAAFAGVAASKTPDQPSGFGCPDEIEDCHEMTHDEWRRETNKIWLLWSGVNALASIFPRAIATYFIARTSHYWTPSFGAMLFGSALGSAAAVGPMMGFWMSNSESPMLGIVSLVITPVLLPALVEAISYAASAKPLQGTSVRSSARLEPIYVPPVPTVVPGTGGRAPAFGLSLGTLYW